MDVCKCGKEKELGQLETKVDKLEKRDTELYEKINKNVDKINAIEKISFQIGIFAEKLIELTEEIKNIKLCMDTNKVPSDYHEMKQDYARLKRQDDNMQHYKRIAIGTIIISVIGAFLIGLKISM